MKIYHAAYLAIFLHFLRRIVRNFISDGIERSLWFNLLADQISLRIHTSSNSVLLNAIKNKMIDHGWSDELLSIGKPKLTEQPHLANSKMPLGIHSRPGHAINPYYLPGQITMVSIP